MAVDDESLAAMDTGVMCEPTVPVWLPGLVTVTVLVIVQVNEAEPVKPALSVTVTTTA